MKKRCIICESYLDSIDLARAMGGEATLLGNLYVVIV